MLKSVIVAAACMVTAFPASASWNCFTDGSGCWEVSDGTCAQYGRQLESHGIQCIGPVAGPEIDLDVDTTPQSWACFSGNGPCIQVPEGSCHLQQIGEFPQTPYCFGTVKETGIVAEDVFNAIKNSKVEGADKIIESLKSDREK